MKVLNLLKVQQNNRPSFTQAGSELARGALKRFVPLCPIPDG